MHPFQRRVTTPGLPGLEKLVTNEARPEILSEFPGNFVPKYEEIAEMGMNGLGAVSLADAAWNILGRLQEAKTDEERKSLMADAQTILKWIENNGILERQALGFANMASIAPRAVNNPLSAHWHLKHDRKPPASVAAGVYRGENGQSDQKDSLGNNAAVSDWLRTQQDDWMTKDANCGDNDWLGLSPGPAHDHVCADSSILIPIDWDANPSAFKNRNDPHQSPFVADPTGHNFGRTDNMPDQAQSPSNGAPAYACFGTSINFRTSDESRSNHGPTNNF